MNKASADRLRQESASGDPKVLVQVVETITDHFAEQAELDPILYSVRFDAVAALRTLGWTRPEIAEETGMSVDRIDDLFRKNKDREEDATVR